MTAEQIEREFREKVSAEIRLVSEGRERYRVFTPFTFEDGDAFSIALRQEHGQWLLTDEGHTYMHLSYDTDERDLRSGTRHRVITNALSVFGVRDRDGELSLPVEGRAYGDSLFSFVQALLRISDVTYLSREQVRSTFLEDFRAFLREVVPEHRRTFDWFDAERDPESKYTVTCRVNGSVRPLFVYGLLDDSHVRDANIGLLQFEAWHLQFQSLAVLENQEEINRKVLARFTDVCDRQFSSLTNNRERIADFLHQAVGA